MRRDFSPPLRPSALCLLPPPVGADPSGTAVAENLRTIEGQLLHERAHDASPSGRREDTLVLRSLAVASPPLGLSASATWSNSALRRRGVPSRARRAATAPSPWSTSVAGQSLTRRTSFSYVPRPCVARCCRPRRKAHSTTASPAHSVRFSPELRRRVQSATRGRCISSSGGATPKARPGKFCGACSLKELCHG